MGKYHIYRVSGTVKFHYDDVLSDSSESAKEVTTDLIKDYVTHNIEIVSLDAEILRDATDEEIEDSGIDED